MAAVDFYTTLGLDPGRAAECAPSIESNDGGSVFTPHYFRHNYASILYRSGVDVLSAQQYLGHTDPATTMRIYTHLADEAEKIRKSFR